MDVLDTLLGQIRTVASEHSMDAYIVGSLSWVPASDDHDGYLDDGRLLKLSPAGIPSRLLLEVELRNGLRLYRHRDTELTNQYKGRRITPKWVLDFIIANSELARQLSSNPPQLKPAPEPSPSPVSYSQQELDDLHQERREVNCACGGMVENCTRCYGSGIYIVDGLGKRVQG